jgi:hypothetical protein
MEERKCMTCEFRSKYPVRGTGEIKQVCECFPVCKVITEEEIKKGISPVWCPLKK